MSKALVITEKPSVARDIVGALGGFREEEGYWEADRYVVTFSVGHLVELMEPEDLDPAYKRWTLDVLPILPTEFRLKPKSGMSERIRTIRKLLKRRDVSEVINACDAGREGELIFREIVQFLESDKPVRRLWLQSMTTEAIRQGFDRLAPGQRFDGLASAAACRSQSDWLIGMNATRALTKRLRGRKERGAWSAGRVQTPTLAILVDREIEILAHVPRSFWTVEARFGAASHEYVGTWFDPEFRRSEDEGATDERIFDEARARAIAAAVEGRSGEARETRKPSRETAPPLFDLTSLQRECNRRFSWSARRTLNAAQRCYEGHKVLTYPRTDSRCLPSDYRGRVDDLIRSFAAEGPYATWATRLRDRGLQNTGRTFDDSRVSDHFAIIPTGAVPKGELPGDDGRLYDLVVRRTLASFLPPAIWTRVERITRVEGHDFRSRARTLDDPGWREVLGQTSQEDPALPPLVAGRDDASDVSVEGRGAEVQEDRTRPPARISEARLLSLMENAGRTVDDEELAAAMHEKGIGTPATRADVIENLISKGYVIRQARGLRPTVKGIRLVDILRRIRADRLASAELTGDMEHRLREVERGQRTGGEFMKEIAEYTTHVVDRARDFDYEDLYPDEEPLGTCPCEQRRPVLERSWFYRCLERPDADSESDCEFRIWKDKAGRYVDAGAVRTLLERGETPTLEGFLTRDGRTYNGVLKLEGKDLKLIPVSDAAGDPTSDRPEYEVNPEPLGPCPACREGRIVETPSEFRCTRDGSGNGGEPCRFVLPRTVCRREIVRSEAEQYVREGRTAMLEEFISRYGRPFSATLFLKENGRHGFEFAPRAPRKRAAKGSTRRGSGRKTTRKKATGKKTTRRKPPGKAATRKKAAAASTRKRTSRRKGTRGSNATRASRDASGED